MPTEHHVLFAIPLDYSLLVEPDVLGMTFAIRLHAMHARLELPTSSDTKDVARGDLEPPLSAPARLTANMPGGWGSRFICGSPVAEIEALLVVVPCLVESGFNISTNQVGGPDMDRLRDAVSRWIESFIYWLRIATAQSLDAKNPDPKLLHHKSKNIVHVVSGGDRVSPASSGSPPFVIEVDRDGPCSERVADGRVLEYAADRASTKGVAPLMLEFLAGARLVCRRGDRQRAIIDAGTIAESALTRLLCLPADHRHTLTPLIDKAQKENLDLPSDIGDHLVRPRNDAVHRGLAPDLSTVARALEIAEELAVRVEPDLIRIDSLRAVHRPSRLDLHIIRRNGRMAG